jgi:hypothetical protein
MLQGFAAPEEKISTPQESLFFQLKEGNAG